jgi:hypothetical protein
VGNLLNLGEGCHIISDTRIANLLSYSVTSAVPVGSVTPSKFNIKNILIGSPVTACTRWYMVRNSGVVPIDGEIPTKG